MSGSSRTPSAGDLAKGSASQALTPISFEVEPFRQRIRGLGEQHWRDLVWRQTRDPYLIWISEVMLQQTQVSRVETRWDEWSRRFPTVLDLANASDAEVLSAWQGMGYNRRALALHRAAIQVVEDHHGEFPHDLDALLALPGVGPATAAGIRAFAFDEPGVYLETNVRAVFIHELFPGAESVSDSTLVPLVREMCPTSDVRGWYYALLDYGAWLKKNVPNPSRRSRSYVRQSRFEGSHRQKRACVLRILLGAGGAGAGSADGAEVERVAAALDEAEVAAGRPPVGIALTQDILEELASEGFCSLRDGRWVIES